MLVYIPTVAGLASFGKMPLVTCIMANLSFVFKYALIVAFTILQVIPADGETVETQKKIGEIK